MLLLRSALFNVLFYALFLAMMVGGAPALLCGRRAVMRLAGAWARASLWLLRVVCGTRVEIRGRENVRAGACIVAAKHQSFLDIIALVSVFPDFTFVLKRELTRIPLFGRYVRACEQIAIDRGRGGSALTQVVRQASVVLAEGRQVLIFPEGTRRPPGAAPGYKLGAAVVYAKTATRCLPVALNSGLFWPRRALVRRPGTVVLALLEPIAPGLGKARFQQTLEDRVERASAALIEEALAATPGLRSAMAPPPDAAPGRETAIRAGKRPAGG